VEFRHEDDKDNWIPAKMDTQLCVGDHVRTSEDSSAIIGFSDLSTFVLKPESEIVVTLPPASDSKLQLLFGNIWVNVKKIANNGTMEVDMSQAVTGIKGTTFVLSETGTTSTLKVIEGTVSFTAKATGQSVEVSTGQTVQADATGLSPVTSFDVNAESADWAKLGAGTATGADSALPVALLAGLAGLACLVVLLFAGIFIVARRRR
jgi:ferric-dicitrate binding protein FerR (iron transport regulator)